MAVGTGITNDLSISVSDQMMLQLGFSEKVTVLYIIAQAKVSSSPSDFAAKLPGDLGLSSEAAEQFAQEIFALVPRKERGSNPRQEQERQARAVARKQYSVLPPDINDGNEEEEVDCGIKRKKMSETMDSDRIKDGEIKRRKLSSETNNDANCDIETLRRISRQAYLKNRLPKQLQKLRDDLEDDRYLFEGVKLSKAEERREEFKRRVYDLAADNLQIGDNIDVDGYRIPDAYDLDQEKRFGAASRLYSEPKGHKEPNWEDYQLNKANMRFGSKNNEIKSNNDYDFVFEDLVEFVRTSTVGQEQPSDEIDNASIASAVAALEEDRVSLPIHRLKEDLIQAVHDHQILIIVGETGSGKTTQIPQYLHEAGYTSNGKSIACTQPRRVAAMSVAARVSQEMRVKLGHEVGYSIRFENCTTEKTRIKYMTDGMLLREFMGEPDLGSYSVVMVDEAHERTLSTDIIFGLVKDIARFRPDLKLLISSATLDAEKFSDFFDGAPMFVIPGRRFPVEIHHTVAPEADYIDAAISTILQVHVKESSGDILVFLTGQEEIEQVEEILNYKTSSLGSKIGELIICPIYSNLPSELQVKIFEPTPENARKVVLATNIAETSLTIEGIRYVIDTGFCKMKSYDPNTGMESLLVTPISKASAIQRSGRAGRTGPGVCYRLYTAYSYHTELEETTTPELQRTNLANVVLTLKNLGINDLLNFDFLDPPPSEAIIKALELLYALGALNKLGELTKTGRRMAELPLDPMLTKMIVASEKYKCSEEAITIAAMLSIGNSIFYCPKGKRLLSDAARMEFYAGDVGDHIALLRIYNYWKEENYSSGWCYDRYIHARSMKRARDIREQLEGLLETVEIELVSNDMEDLEAIKKVVLSGFFPHTARLQEQPSGFDYRTIKSRQAVSLHPSSGFYRARPLPKWVLYNELVLTTKEFIRQVTEVKPEWLVEVAPHFYQLKEIGLVQGASASTKPPQKTSS